SAPGTDIDGRGPGCDRLATDEVSGTLVAPVHVDRVGPRAAVDRPLGLNPSRLDCVHRVVPGPRVDLVAGRTAEQVVVAFLAIEGVLGAVAVQPVVAGTAVQHVTGLPRVDRVVARIAEHLVAT